MAAEAKQGSHRSPWHWATWALVALAALIVTGEHRAHLLDYLPFLLIAACPLMHLLHRHGGHRHDKDERS